MNVEFENPALRDLYENGKSREYKAFSKSKVKVAAYIRVIALMVGAKNIEDIKAMSFLHYEKLKHSYSGYSSVRIKNGEIFKEKDDKITIALITLSTDHYGNK